MPADLLHRLRHAATDSFNVQFDDSTVFILSQTMNETTTLRFIYALFLFNSIRHVFAQKKIAQKILYVFRLMGVGGTKVGVQSIARQTIPMKKFPFSTTIHTSLCTIAHLVQDADEISQHS